MAVPTIHIVRFWTKFKPDRNDKAKLVPVDMIAYGPVGQTQKTLIHAEVNHLASIQEGGADETNPAIAMARARWDIIEPHYKAWKAGQEMPLVGTPLAAWNAITPESAEVFKSRGVKTVEDIASLTDAAIEGIPVPHLRDLKRNAKRFIDSAETTRFAAVLAEKDQKLDNQQLELTEQARQIAALMSRVDQLAELAAAKADDDEKPRAKSTQKAA